MAREGRESASNGASQRGDLAANVRSFLLIWGLPIAALALGGAFDLERYAWPPALGFMGAGCLANAFRCGRLHCFITGPYFLAGAAVSLIHGTGVVPLGPEGWTWIGTAMLVGGLGLTFLPEAIWGRYVKRAHP